MIRIPGQRGKDLCDSHLGMTRRDVLRVGGSGMLGLTLGGMFETQAQAAKALAQAQSQPNANAAQTQAAMANPQATTLVTGNPGCLYQIRAGIRAAGLPLRVIHPALYLAERLKG